LNISVYLTRPRLACVYTCQKCCTVSYCSVLAQQGDVVSQSTVQHGTVRLIACLYCCFVAYRAVPYCAVPYCAVPCSAYSVNTVLISNEHGSSWSKYSSVTFLLQLSKTKPESNAICFCT